LFIISLVVIATRPSICSLANTKEEKMGVLVFVCPTSGHEVVTGLEIDPASYQGLKHETAEIKCSACGLSQNFFRSKHDWSDNLQIGTTKD
jgi:hypothetical protein